MISLLRQQKVSDNVNITMISLKIINQTRKKSSFCHIKLTLIRLGRAKMPVANLQVTSMDEVSESLRSEYRVSTILWIHCFELPKLNRTSRLENDHGVLDTPDAMRK